MPKINLAPNLIVVGDGGGKLPSEARVSPLFLTFPFVKGIDDLCTRRWGDVLVKLRKPLSVKAYKLLLCLIAQKQEKVEMAAKDVGPIIGVHTVRRDFPIVLNQLYEAELLFVFYNKDVLPPTVRPSLEGGKYVVRTRVASDLVFSFLGKRRACNVQLGPGFLAAALPNKKAGYCTVKLDVLKKLSSKTTSDLLTYLLTARSQKVNTRDFLLQYFCAVDIEYLRNLPDRVADSKRKILEKMFNSVLKSLEKLRELKVVETYEFSQCRIPVGRYSAKWFSELRIYPKTEVKGGNTSNS
ncbi:hypothetical protein [Desulfurobacterium sp.]